jgi:hypothetical protein
MTPRCHGLDYHPGAMTDTSAGETNGGGRAFGGTIRVDIPPPVQPPVVIEDPERGGWTMTAPDLPTAVAKVADKLAQAERDYADAAERVTHWAAVRDALDRIG